MQDLDRVAVDGRATKHNSPAAASLHTSEKASVLSGEPRITSEGELARVHDALMATCKRSR